MTIELKTDNGQVLTVCELSAIQYADIMDELEAAKLEGGGTGQRMRLIVQLLSKYVVNPQLTAQQWDDSGFSVVSDAGAAVFEYWGGGLEEHAKKNGEALGSS